MAESSWNPLRCGGTALPVPLLALAKVIAVALLATNHVRLLPDPFLPFVPVLDGAPPAVFQWTLKTVFVASAVALLLNRWVRASAFVLGATILVAVVSSKAYYGNNKTFCGVMLFLAGLYQAPASVWLLRAQMVIVYFGAGLNKLIDPDWQTGVFFDHWASARLKQPLYLWAAPLLPPLVAGKFMCWLTIAVELGLAAALPFRKLWPYAIWVSLLFHASLLEFTGTTFTMFFYAMEAAMLAFVAWPREMVVIYDGDCGICNKIRRAMERVDFERAFRWETSQSGAGDRWGIARQALNEKLHFVVDGRVTRGFHACKLILLYNPALYLVLAAAIALPPEGWSWYRRVLVGVTLAFFFPLFNPVGEWVYSLVARNRHRIGPGTCAVEPR